MDKNSIIFQQVLFYDYGTLKTYEPDEVFYLHKRFSSLPAQAIPCGLYNVKPILSDRWKKSVNSQFIDRIDGHKGLCNIIIKSIDELVSLFFIKKKNFFLHYRFIFELNYFVSVDTFAYSFI